ncbi:MAG: putative glycoside hydrolase [Oscillospiraceae bacterium]
MKKGQKIRRYGNIYDRGPGSGSPLIAVAIFVGLLVFALIGWSIYTPLRNLILGDESSSGAPFSAPPPALDESAQPEPTSSEPAAVGGSQPPQGSPLSAKVAGLYVPPSALEDEAALDALIASAKNAGMTALLVDAKDATGAVLFTTENERAIAGRTVAKNAFHAETVAKKISDAGLIPIARLHAFRDPRMANVERTMAVMYYDTNAIWLDNAPELGGNPWLNPYSDETQQYITDLAVELTRAGFGQIVLDSVQFPSGVGLEKAGFGAKAKAPRAEVLRSFLEQLDKAVRAAGGECLPSLPAQNVGAAEDGAGNPMIYGGNPAALLGERAVLSLDVGPTSLRDGLLAAKTRAPDTQWIVLLPAYQEDGTPQTADALQKQLAQSEQGQADGYLLYNPQGSYLLQ